MFKSSFWKILCLFTLLTAVFPADRPASETLYEKAYEAWDTGDYVGALQGFDALLRGPEADRYFERIALLTGELYEVTQIAPDGRNLHFSPDGRFASFSTGSRPKQFIHLLDAANNFKPIAEINGFNEVFAPSGKTLAFLRVKDTPEMGGLRKDLAAANASSSPDYATITNLGRKLDYLEAKLGEIVVRDLSTGRESALPDGGLLKGELAFSADGRELYFVGAKESDATSNDIYGVPVDPGVAPADPRALTSGPEFKVSPLTVPGGKFLIYSISGRPPFQKPGTPAQPQTKPDQPGQAAQPAAAGQTAQPAPSNRPLRAPAGQSRKFVVLDLASGSVKAFDGRFQAASADGSAVLFIGRDGADNTLNVLKLDGAWTPTTFKKTSESIYSAAFSPDRSRVVYEMTAAGNTEIFVAGADGRGEARLTHEVQNDHSPRFLSPKLVLAIKGESRYSRAYLYEIETLGATKLFHNNTVRTLSFEYEWAPDPAGTKILIAAQRNGDTMVPVRGVFLLDLGKKITKDTLLARIAGLLASEKALRAKGEEMFKPIAADVRSVISAVSTTRIYGYEEAFFNFDSKHVTMPGNKPAAEYTFKTFESFGYKPEYQWLANRPVKTANVIAVLKGTENPELFYVLGAHYDSVIQGPGADDDISAMAALLETARVLAGKPLPSSVIFAAFTGEESGLWGSREFARVGKEKGLKVMAGLNNDVVGWMNDNRFDDTIRYSNAAIRDLEHAAALGFTRLITYDTHYVKSTDAASLYDVWGDIMGGLGSYPLLGSPHYHQPSDVLETVNHQLVTEVAKFNTAAVMLLASSPSPVRDLKVVKAGPDGVELSWTANPEKGISHYVVTWGPEGKTPAGSRKVKEPRAVIRGLKPAAGEKWWVSVRAVNARGLQSWDETKVLVDGLVPATQAPGCSTVVVGKKASATGEVLLGHNEDNEGRLVVACYRMPRLNHAPGERIVAEEGRAKIPQVAETAAFLWWETIAEWKASYSDDFVNEYGVAVVSDSCWPSKELHGELVEGGIGYALRRIIAERAKTAREGVDIAAALVDRYGYADSGRTYIIADKNEGWLFEVVMGKHYVARRVADDEVAFIPNWYTIREVDFKDKERWVVSPDLVSYAAKQGWFTPKAPGDMSGFDFAKAYMSPALFNANWKPTQDPRQDYNVLRHKYALDMITGGSFGYGRDYPFAVKPARKMGLEDLMALFRTHYEGKPDYRTTSPANSPHSLATICASETQESFIIQLRENPDFTVVWWTAGRPCTSVYAPWYLGIQRVPDGYGWKDPVEAFASHFKPSEDDLNHNPGRAWWAFMDLQNALEPRYFGDAKGRNMEGFAGTEVLAVQKRWKELEKEWLGQQKAVEAEAAAAGKKNEDAARNFLTRYTVDQAVKAWTAAKEKAAEICGVKAEK